MLRLSEHLVPVLALLKIPASYCCDSGRQHIQVVGHLGPGLIPSSQLWPVLALVVDIWGVNQRMGALCLK